MKQYFRLLLLLLIAQSSNAAGNFESGILVPSFNIYETTTNTDLIPQQCQVQIYFNFNDTVYKGKRVYLSINGLLEDMLLENSDPITYDLTPGKYVFRIWGGPGYEEIVTDSIEFKSQTVNKANVRMDSPQRIPVVVSKPVIYFHSDEDLSVQVNVDPVGEFLFTYPEINSGWNGTVKQDGSFVINEVNFPYLFWESNQMYSFQPSDNGFKVERKDIVKFLAGKCKEFGFNTKETTDFITFWGPRLSASESVFIQFTVDEACSQFADLSISPAPNDIKRVYIQFTEWSEVMSPYLKDKTFDSIGQNGFTVLEWGGFSFSLPETAYKY